jgi:thiol-disulfide isomerase/thioredoxin
VIDTVGEEAFDGLRLRRPGVVLVSFLADWCPHCHRFLPVIDRLHDEGFEVLKADVSSEESPLWDRFEVAIVPTVAVFRDGERIYQANGVGGVGLPPPAVDAVRHVARAARAPADERRSPTT